jgi:hypothetical protein
MTPFDHVLRTSAFDTATSRIQQDAFAVVAIICIIVAATL